MGFFNLYLLQSNPDIHPSIDVYQYSTAFAVDPYNLTDSQRKWLGWDLKQVVIKCKFNGVDCDINNDFEWYFSPQYGNCFEFNSIPKNNQVNTSSAIRLIIFSKNTKLSCLRWFPREMAYV